MNFRIIIYILGLVLKIETAAMALPLICAFCYKETSEINTFIICMAICLATGILLSAKTPKNKAMYAKEGFSTVALSWIVLSLFGALPFFISGYIPNYIDAFFEIVSGFTTTGASVLTDVESLPRSILMWRSFSHWLGGMGVLVFLLAIQPITGGSSVYLIKAESPGPSVSKLVPKVRSTALLLYGIYIALTVIQTFLMLGGGEDLFTALTLTFGTAGTGGFSILNSGIASYSAYTQYVITIFMILFGVDFTLYYILIFKDLKTIIKSDEVKTYFIIIISAIVLIFINTRGIFASVEEALRHIAFTVGSVITTTGYATTDYNAWPEFSKTIIVALMFIGACAGSTGGGIKVSRIIILFKSIIKEIRTIAHPRTVLKIKMNGTLVEHETVRSVNVYMSAYVIIFSVALLLISLDNFDFTTNFTAIAATINNIGPGLNAVGPAGNFSQFSGLSKLVMSICMLTGRLEIFPMLILFSPRSWKK